MLAFSCMAFLFAILFSCVGLCGASVTKHESQSHALSSKYYQDVDGLVEDLNKNLDDGNLQSITSFNLTDYYPLISENQLSSELCWAFSSSKALESALMIGLGEYYNFSELGTAYLGYYHGYNNLISGEKGKFEDFVKISQNYGLIYESDVPNENLSDLSVTTYADRYSYIAGYANLELASLALPVKLASSETYNDYNTLNIDGNSDIVKTIKNYIMKYGGLFAGLSQGTIYEDLGVVSYKVAVNPDGTKGKSFTRSESHAVCLIGWDDRYGFLALNSWGVESSYEQMFYIPYNFDADSDGSYFTRDNFYSSLSGFIVDEDDSESIKLKPRQSSEFASSVTPQILEKEGYKILSNMFVFEEDIDLEFEFSENIIPQIINVKIFKGKDDVSNRFKIDPQNESNNVIISSSDNFYADENFYVGGTYTVKFYENENLIGSKQFVIYTGLELSYVKFYQERATVDLATSYALLNDISTSLDSATFYTNYQGQYNVVFYTTYLNSQSKVNGVIGASNFRAYLTSSEEGKEHYELSENIVSINSTQGFPNANRIISVTYLSDYVNCMLELEVTLTSPVYSNCTRKIYFKFYVSDGVRYTSSDTTDVIYVLDGGENNKQNIDRLPNYGQGYDTEMTDIKLYSPVKQNHRFTGWYLNKTAEGVYQNQIEVISAEFMQTNSGPLTLYAKWEAMSEPYYDSSNEISLAELKKYDGTNKKLSDVIEYGDTIVFSYTFEATDALLSNNFKIYYVAYLNGNIVNNSEIDVSSSSKKQSILIDFGHNHSYEKVDAGSHKFSLLLHLVVNNTYNVSQSLEYNFDVAQKALKVKYQNMQTTYDGNQHEPSLDDIIFNEVEHYGEALDLSISLQTGTNIPRMANIYSYALNIGNKNFKLENESDSNFTYTINKKEIELDFETDKSFNGNPFISVVYNGTSRVPQPKKIGLVGDDSVTVTYQNIGSKDCVNVGTYYLTVDNSGFSNYVISSTSKRTCVLEITPAYITISLNSIEERVQTAPLYRREITWRVVAGEIYSNDKLELTLTSEGLTATKSGVYPIECIANDSNYVVRTENNNEATYTLTGYYYVHYTLPNGEIYTEKVEEGEKPNGVPADIYKCPWLSSMSYSSALENELGVDLYIKVKVTNYIWIVISVIIVVTFVVIYLVISRKERRNKVR